MRKQSLTRRNKCCRCLCCACCLPAWAGYMLWFIIIAIIICVIVIAALLGTFKMPTVDVLDVTNAPGEDSIQITYKGSEFDLALGLIVNVNNPNVLPIRLKNIQATANLPAPDGSGESYYMGSGFLAAQTVPKNSNYNFTFPFNIEYDYNSVSSQAMLSTLLDECGLYGSESSEGLSSSQITVSYTIHLSASVLFVTIHPTLSGSASFDCPFSVCNR
ncbi:hypothetical protein BX666DRAFT_1898568 [Dichotomocladium elegans]|nr:hypothetical protein BX666DRAFT_1898568 [Dichotomocladium elegans]